MPASTGHRTVYGLYDPSVIPVQIRYIGCTKQPLRNRLRAHVLEAETSTAETDKLVWLRSLIMDGCEPKILELEQCTEETWESREMAWIAGTPGLLNDAPGGLGLKQVSPATRNAISRALVGRTQSEATLQKRRETMAAKPYRHSEAIKQAMSERRRGAKMQPLSDTTKSKLSQSISNLMWVTDGTTNRRIQRTQDLPPGWWPGRK